MSDGIPTSCTERKDVFTEQSANVTSRASCPGRGTGKRFARRAKRWAELQQRRYNQRLVAVRTGFLEAHEESPCMYDSFGVPCTTTHFVSGHEALDAAPNVKNVCDTISRWMSQPRYSKQCSLTSLETSLFMTSASFEYATHTRYSIRQIASESSSSRTTNQERSKSRDLSSNSAELSDLLSSIKTDLSVTCGRTRRRSSSSTSSSTADSGSFSLHLPLSPGRAGISRFFINTAPPPEREWVMIRHADPDRPIATFTVLCYNVLCDKYATVNQYSYCPSWALNWEYRKMSIMKEIRNYEADIITLQEVETEQFRLLFQPELKVLGYTGIFSPKSRAKTMNEEDRKYVDGCAIFWKSEKFEMEREHLIEFTQVVVKKASSSEHMLNRVMPRDNIALCAVLRIKENVYNNRRLTMAAADNVVGSPLVVCTAHIHWDPELCDVKLVQTMMLAHELYKLLEEVAEQFRITPQQTPVLICGDLNSLPDSGVFEFLSRGQISRSHTDLKGFRDDSCLERFSSGVRDPTTFTHSLRLDSAVELSNIPFTNYTLDFKGMIDYIFSTPQSLARLGFLGAFDSNWVSQNKIIGFPHPHVPSDHIPIMAQYAVIPTSHQRAPPPPHPLNSYPR